MRSIVSATNATFKEVRALVHEARARSKAQRTVIEGEHLCRAWLDRGWQPELALVDADAVVDRLEIAACVQRLQAAGTDLVAVPHALIKSACATDSPVPLLCVVRPVKGEPTQCIGQDCVLLDGLQDPGNVGTILRTAAAAGVRHLICGPGCASIWSPKVLRAGMGAHVALNLIETDDLSAFAMSLGVTVLGTDAAANQSIHRADLRHAVAWAFGAEGAGLSASLRAILTQAVSIPQTDAVESLNVAAAAAVCLFEMRRQRLA